MQNSKNKSIHIVFQVLNFIAGQDSKPYNLSCTDKLLLILLARHKGEKGIYPSLSTLSKELKKTTRTVIRVLHILEQKKLIFIIKNRGKSNHYVLSNMFHTSDAHVTSDTNVTTKLVTPVSPPLVTSVSPTSDTSVTLYNPLNNIDINNTERARTKRAPLSPSYHPPQKLKALEQEASNRSGLPKEQLLVKFKNIAKSKEKTSCDWDAEYENFLLSERPSVVTVKTNNRIEEAPRSAVNKMQEYYSKKNVIIN